MDSTGPLDPTVRLTASGELETEDEQNLQGLVEFLDRSQQPNSVGRLAHYEVLLVLGHGGFGVVLKAFDERLHRWVAIKVMHPHLTAMSASRKRFLREARAAAAIRHENVVHVYSVDEAPLPFLVMEFIDGQTLQQKLDEQGPLEIFEILHVGRQIASGLSAAHAIGLIHRDIKPANILLEKGPEGRVKISDFGLARTMDDASMTQSGAVSGTPMYMAPEQAMGKSLDHRADIFSLGSVLYHMACGQPPFHAESTIAVLRKVAEDPPRQMQELIPEIPDWFVAVIAKLHAKVPDDRFQTAKEVVTLFDLCMTECKQFGQPISIDIPQKTSLQQTGQESLDVPNDQIKSYPADVPCMDGGDRRFLSKSRLFAVGGAMFVLLIAFLIVKSPVQRSVTLNGPRNDDASRGDNHATDYGLERSAAQWVLSMNGASDFLSDNALPITPAEGTLPSEPFVLTGIRIFSTPSLTDADLSALHGCRHLRSLLLFGTSITGTGLANLGPMPTLFDLDLNTNALTDEGLATIASFSNLRSLNLDANPALTDMALRYLQSLVQLESLQLDDLKISDTGLQSLSTIHQLRKLHVSMCPGITDIGLETLIKQNPALEVLSIANAGEGRRTLEPLQYATRLQSLIVSGDQITPDGLKILQTLKNLQSLEVWSPIKTDELVRVSELRDIHRLCLRFQHGDRLDPINEAYISMAQISSLEEIDIWGTQISPSDTVLEKWAEMKQLKSLTLDHDVSNRRYTAAGVEGFHQLRPDVTLVVDGNHF